VLEVGKDRSRELQLSDAIRANVRHAVDHLRHGSRILEDMVNDGQLVIVGSVYDIATGHVEFLDVPAALREAL
jgi:carbonic anhydrase